jgi:glutamine phosphoribosylpyrophosphate amidotransferase
LHYLSLEGAVKAVGLPADSLNAACFTGEYPVWPDQLGKKPQTDSKPRRVTTKFR